MKKKINNKIYRIFFILLVVSICSMNHIVAQKASDKPLLSKEKIEKALTEAYDKYKDLKEGKNADYIKELATVDPNIFGIAIVTTDGTVYTKGDIKSMVSIQSVSKVFVMAQDLEEQGPQAIMDKIGVDATGM